MASLGRAGYLLEARPEPLQGSGPTSMTLWVIRPVCGLRHMLSLRLASPGGGLPPPLISVRVGRSQDAGMPFGTRERVSATRAHRCLEG